MYIIVIQLYKIKNYFVDYERQADLKLFFVKYKSQVGWNKKEKKQLMHGLRGMETMRGHP